MLARGAHGAEGNRREMVCQERGTPNTAAPFDAWSPRLWARLPPSTMDYEPDRIPTSEMFVRPRFNINNARPAGFWVRCGAFIIDALVIAVAGVASLFVSNWFVFLALSAVVALYRPLTEGLLGGTVGKIAVGTKIINGRGHRPGLTGGLLRNLIFLVPHALWILLYREMLAADRTLFGFENLEELRAFLSDHASLYASWIALWSLAQFSRFIVAFSPRHRGLHDYLAGTYVVHRVV